MPTLTEDATSAPYALPFAVRPRLHDDPEPEPEPGDGPQPDPEPEPEPDPTPGPDPVADPDPDKPLGPKGEKALAAAKAAQRKAEAEARQARKDAATAAAKVQEFEDAKKSELERAQATADRALARADAAEKRAVLSEIRSLAVEAEFVDPTDGVDALAGDHRRFLGADGDVDADAVRAALEDVLARKPHWKRQADPKPDPEKKPARTTPPKPDPSQGPRGGGAAPDFTDPAVLAAEAARLGLRTNRAPQRVPVR